MNYPRQRDERVKENVNVVLKSITAASKTIGVAGDFKQDGEEVLIEFGWHKQERNADGDIQENGLRPKKMRLRLICYDRKLRRIKTHQKSSDWL